MGMEKKKGIRMERKKIRCKWILPVLLFAIGLLTGAMETKAAETEKEEPAGYVVMSIEKSTLGQEFILEPQKIPFYRGENLAEVTDRALKEYADRDYMYTGTLEKGFYLSDIQDPDRASIENTMPEYIKKMADALVQSHGLKALQFEDINDPEYLGEFDYFSQSGWMYSVENVFPVVGAADTPAVDGQVVRWQFTLVGLGGDLGNSGFTVGESHATMDKTELMKALAEVRGRKDLLSEPDIRNAYEKCMNYAKDMTAEKEEVKPYLDILKQAQGKNVITALVLPEGVQETVEVKFGTLKETAEAALPKWMQAVIDGKTINIPGITWQCEDYKPETPGEYLFTPILPEAYSTYTLKCSFPQMKVIVKGLPGDLNGDGKVNLRDISYMAASMGRTDRMVCDLNQDGSVNMKDFLLLKKMIFPQTATEQIAQTEEKNPAGRIEAVFDKTFYQKNETAVVSVYVKRADFDTFALNLQFDSSVMQYKSSILSDGLTPVENALQADGTLLVGGASLNGTVKASGEGEEMKLVTIEFQVLEAGKPKLDFSASYLPVMDGRSHALLSDGTYAPVEAAVSYLSGGEAGILGDVNGDGIKNLSDAIALLNSITNGENVDKSVGDVNGDGVVNLQDAIKLLNMLTAA